MMTCHRFMNPKSFGRCHTIYGGHWGRGVAIGGMEDFFHCDMLFDLIHDLGYSLLIKLRSYYRWL